MLTSKPIIRYFVYALGLVAAFATGKFYQNIIYFDDDTEIKSTIYSQALDNLSSKRADKKWRVERNILLQSKSDFFRTSSNDCVRFLPKRYEYSFVVTYCKDKITGNVVTTHY